MKRVWLSWCCAAGLVLLPAWGWAQSDSGSAAPTPPAKVGVTRDTGRIRYDAPGKRSPYSAHAQFRDLHPLPSGPTGTGRVVFNQASAGAASGGKPWGASNTGRVQYAGGGSGSGSSAKRPAPPSDTGRVRFGPSAPESRPAVPAPQPATYRAAPTGATGTGRVQFAGAGSPATPGAPAATGNDTGRVQFSAPVAPAGGQVSAPGAAASPASSTGAAPGAAPATPGAQPETNQPVVKRNNTGRVQFNYAPAAQAVQ